MTGFPKLRSSALAGRERTRRRARRGFMSDFKRMERAPSYLARFFAHGGKRTMTSSAREVVMIKATRKEASWAALVMKL